MTVTMIRPPKRRGSGAAGQECVRAGLRCPYCGQLFFDRASNCTGTIHIKCRRCGKRLEMDLALRMVRR